MKSIVRWAIQNSPAMNTLVIALLVCGAISLLVMRREVFPAFELEIIVVTVPFPGATPEEVEDGICEKLESALNGLDGIRKVTSVARESFAFMVLELKSNVRNVQRVLNDVRSQVDQITTLPPRAERPEVRQIIFRSTAIQVGLLAPPSNGEQTLADRQQLRELAENVREELLQLPPAKPSSPIRRLFAPMFQTSAQALSYVEITAARPFEIAVEIPEDTLQNYGLSLSQVAQLLRLQNIEMPGGKMEAAGKEIVLRGKNKRETGVDIAQIPLISTPDGGVVTVGDLGDVVDGFEETASEHLIDGRRGLVLAVACTNDEDLLTVTDTVHEYVRTKKLPPGYELKTWSDISVDVKDRLDMLTTNGIQGLILVFITLAIFLELRLAFWVAMGIPVAILGAGVVLILTGQTLNMLSMFAFLMTLGIVVDDAIVIGENIYTHRQMGKDFLTAAIDGTFEVVPSVTASVMTTVIAFMPLLFVSGVMGKFIAVMPVAVIAMLLVSLLESIFVLPVHLAHQNNLFLRVLGVGLYVLKPLYALSHWVNAKADWLLGLFVGRIYAPFIRWSLKNWAIVVSSAVALFLVAVGFIVSGLTPFEAFPKLDGNDISATVAFPDGTGVAATRAATQQLQDALAEVDREIAAETGRPVVKVTYVRIGEVGDAFSGPTGVTDGSHVATVAVQLVPAGQRTVRSSEVINRWRAKVPKIIGTELLSFGSRSMGPGGKKIEFKLLAAESGIPYLAQAAEECKAYLASKVGVTDIEDDDRAGKYEFSLKLNEQGRALGLDEQTLANSIRGGYFGEEVMRLQRGRNEVKLMVRYPKSERNSLAALEDVKIRDAENVERALADVADIEYSRAPSEINRLDGKRAITITADVDRESNVTSTEIVAEMKSDFFPAFLRKFEQQGGTLFVDWEGDQQETADSISSMMTGLGIALLAMFVLLTMEFRSYMQPAIIMFVIPFSLVGAVMGHYLMGLDITLFSMFGLIALTGVVVNDAIVLVDFVNHAVDNGTPLYEALEQSGQRRFRPILLTSVTTIAGLFPMLLEKSLQAQVLIPMATSIIFGLFTSTVLVLVFVPVLYMLHARVVSWLMRGQTHEGNISVRNYEIGPAGSTSSASASAPS